MVTLSVTATLKPICFNLWSHPVVFVCKYIGLCHSVLLPLTSVGKARLLKLLFCEGQRRRLQSSLSPPSYPFWGRQWRNKQGRMQSQMHFAVYCHVGHCFLDKLSSLFLLLSFIQNVSLITQVTKRVKNVLHIKTPETADPETECRGIVKASAHRSWLAGRKLYFWGVEGRVLNKLHPCAIQYSVTREVRDYFTNFEVYLCIGIYLDT